MLYLSDIFLADAVSGLSFSRPGDAAFNDGSQLQIGRYTDHLSHQIPMLPVPGDDALVQHLDYASLDAYVTAGESSPPEAPTLGFQLNQHSFVSRALKSPVFIDNIQDPQISEEAKRNFITHFASTLFSRHFAIALLYGGYQHGGWQYFGQSDGPGWAQDKACAGLHSLATPGEAMYHLHPDLHPTIENGFQFNTSGNYDQFSAEHFDLFVRESLARNNHQLHALVMNQQVFERYQNEIAPSSPHHREDIDASGTLHTRYRGVPLLRNDYILTYDSSDTAPFYQHSEFNPERHPNDPTTPTASNHTQRSAIYALKLGVTDGLFGFYPASFGDSPLKLDVVDNPNAAPEPAYQVTMQFGLGTKTRHSICRWGYIDLSAV